MGFRLYFILFLFTPAISFSQDSAVLFDVPFATVVASEKCGLGNAQKNAIEYPANSGKLALKKLDFWVTGISAAGDTLAVVTDVFNNKSTWYPGPFSISGNRTHVANNEWVPFVNMNKAAINNHRQNFAVKGYVVPSDIQNWPSNYSISGFPKVLAGYADYNMNSTYDPQNGDYPYVPGNKQLFTLASDSHKLVFVGGKSNPVDMSVLWFTPENADSLPNTIYFRSTICNRGKVDINNVRISAVPDMGIGNPTDNYFSSDATFGAIIGYNAPGNDAVYGNNWPAVAVGWLSQKATNSMYFENGNDNVKGAPVSRSDYYKLSNSFWKTGTPLSFNNSGLDGSPVAKFIYSNGSDPAQSNKDWDEVPGNDGRKTGLIAVGNWTITAGQCKVADGHVTVLPNAPDSAAIRRGLSLIDREYSKSEFSLSTPTIATKNTLKIWPNPLHSNGEMHIQCGTTKGIYSIYNEMGILVHTAIDQDGILVLNLPQGCYVLRMENGQTARFVVLD